MDTDKLPTQGPENLPPELNFQPASTLPNSIGQKKSNKWLIIIVALIVFLVLVGSVILLRHTAKPKLVETEATQSFTASTTQYPASYIDAQLPQLPEAQLMSLSRNNAAISEGPVQVLIFTNMSIEEILNFYDTQLTTSGWQRVSDVVNNDGDTERTYQKGVEYYSITAGRNSNNSDQPQSENAILIDWRQV